MFDMNLKVPLSTITTTLNRLSKRANTTAEKNYLYQITQALGTAISEEHKEFNVTDFVKACGVDPAWVKAA